MKYMFFSILILIIFAGCSQDTKTYTTSTHGDNIILEPNPIVFSGNISAERKYVLASYFDDVNMLLWVKEP